MMNLLRRWRAMLAYSRHTPWVESPTWLKEDSVALNTYLKSDSGQKLKAYLVNYVLRKQSEAISNTTNLKEMAGSCVGSKAILTQIEILAEPENYTAEEAEAPESP